MTIRAVARRMWLLFLFLALPSWVQGQGSSTGTQYVLFWRGDLRIIATRPNTRVTIYDCSTGTPMSPAAWSGNFNTNSFDLDNIADSFEASNFNSTTRIRIVTTTARGPKEDKPVITWTGSLEATLKHPLAPPTTTNAWMSNLPVLAPGSVENGTEIGKEFYGFVTEQMFIFARKTGQATNIQIDDLATNVETDTDDTQTLTRASASFLTEDALMEVYRVKGFEDDTVHVTANTDIQISVGVGMEGTYDWTTTPPSWGTGEDSRELGTLFYTFVGRDLTIFPTVDNTRVTITDLSDGDDSTTLTLSNGDLSGDYDIFTDDLYARNGTGITGRASSPAVRILTLGASAPFENDIVRVETDRPVLVYVGPKGSDVGEYADVTYTVQTGPTNFLTYGYAQNGGAEDFQLFSFSQSTNVNITSLSYTLGFGSATHHDWALPIPTNWLGGNATYNDYYWASAQWAGEMLRITSDGPITIIDGDYDGPNYGCFIPFVSNSGLLLPIADAGPDLELCPGVNIVTLDGSNSFDADTTPGGGILSWTWDIDSTVDSDGDGNFTNDPDLTGSVLSWALPGPGPFTVTLTFTDDDGQVDTDVLTVYNGDTYAPVISCSVRIDANASALGTVFVPVQATAQDACDQNPVLVNDRTASGGNASDVYPCGDTTVVFTATDSSGNEGQCQTLVAVADVTAPGVSCPARLDADADLTGAVQVGVLATAQDACDANPAITNDRTAGGADASDRYTCGPATVNFTGTDASGNKGQCASLVFVHDVTGPDPGCPAQVDAVADTATGATFVSVLAKPVDNCDPAPTATNDRTAGGPDASGPYPCGLTPVVFTARDTDGNSAQCATNVNVTSPAPPVAVGWTLRAIKDLIDPYTIVHWQWDLAPAPQPWEHYVMTRTDVVRANPRPYPDVSQDPALKVTRWTDSNAAGPLLFYYLYSADCAGTYSIEP